MADDWHDPTTLLDFATSEVVTATKMDRIRDDLTALKAGLMTDAQATSEIIHTHKTGTLANLPSPGNVGRFYYTTDLGVMFFDDGTRMVPVWATVRTTDFFYDDFTSLIPGAWADISSGSPTGTVTNYNGAATRYRLQTNTSASGRAGIALPASGLTGIYATSRVPAYVEFYAAVKSASRLNETIWIGLVDSEQAVTTNPNNGIFFRKVDTGTEQDWQSVTRSGASEVGSANSISGFQNADFHKFEIRINSASSVAFYVDDALKFTHTTNIPSANLKLVGIVDETASANKEIQLDHCIFAAAQKPST